MTADLNEKQDSGNDMQSLNLFRRSYLKIKGGDTGPLFIILGFVLICIFFQLMNDKFLSAQNLSNLTLQMTSTGIIALAVLMVLLLGEIDMSAAAVSGVAGAVTAIISVNLGWSPILAMIIAIVICSAIGFIQGMVIVKFGVPSFVVTMGGSLAWQGLLLLLLGAKGSIPLPFEGIVAKLANTYFDDYLGYIITIIASLLYLFLSLRTEKRRKMAGLGNRPMSKIMIRFIGLLVFLSGITYLMGSFRGIPLALLIFVGLIAVMDLIVRRTTFGRHVLAIGGNTEAARRAGINVDRTRISIFIISSSIAAIGGIMSTSRLVAVNTTIGSGSVMLNSIAAAIIGGTSMFGGRGSAYSALLGILVIQSIANGMDLLGFGSAIKFMVTGLVLALSVVIDAISRKKIRA